MYTREAIIDHGLPFPGIAQYLEQRFCHCRGVKWVNQASVAAVLDNISGATVFGSNYGQTAGGRFQQGQAKGFGERGIDEHAVAAGGQAVKYFHFIGVVLPGVGHLAVEVVAIDQQQQFGQDLLRVVFHLPNVVTITGDNHQVGHFLQLLRFTIGFHQSADIFAFVGAR